MDLLPVSLLEALVAEIDDDGEHRAEVVHILLRWGTILVEDFVRVCGVQWCVRCPVPAGRRLKHPQSTELIHLRHNIRDRFFSLLRLQNAAHGTIFSACNYGSRWLCFASLLVLKSVRRDLCCTPLVEKRYSSPSIASRPGWKGAPSRLGGTSSGRG